MAGKYDGSILIDTKGDASGFNKMIGGMSGALKGFMGLIGAAFSVAAVVNFVKESVAEFNQLAEAQAKLTQVMRNTIQASDDEIRSIMGLIDAQEELGVVSADAQTAGAQELGTYLSLTSSLETLIPVLNDMAAQQLGIGASAESVTQIATMLGKVMEGQTSALSRYGYSFDAAQEKILKFGTEAQKAAVLAEVIGSSVGGMNEALAQTDAGRQFQLAQAFGQVKEQFGAAFSQISTLFIPALKVVAQALSVVANLARQAAQYVAMLFGKQLTTTSSANSAANTTEANTAAAASSNAAAKSYDNMAGSASDAAKSEKSLAKATKDAGKAAKDALAPFDDLNVLQQEVATGSGGGAGGVEDLGGVGGIGTGIVGIAEDVAMTGPFLAFMERLRALLEPLSKISLDNISEAFKKIKEAMGENLKRTLEFWEWVWYNVLVPMAQWVVEDGLPAFLNAVSKAMKGLGKVVETFRTAAKWLFDNFLKPLGEVAGDAIVKMLNGIGEAFEVLGDFVDEHQGVILEIIKPLLSLALGIFAVNKAASIANGIVTVFQKLGKAIIAFGTALMAHPIILTLGLLAGAIMYFVARAREARELKISVDVKAAKENLESIKKEVDDIQENYAETTVKIKMDLEKGTSLTKELEALQSKPNLGEGDAERMREISVELVTLYPELAKYVGADGLIHQEAGEVQTLITEYSRLEQQKAYSKMIGEMNEQHARAILQLETLKNLEDTYYGDLTALNERAAAMKETQDLIDDVNFRIAAGGMRPERIDEQRVAFESLIDVLGGVENIDLSGIDTSLLFDDEGALRSAEYFRENQEAAIALAKALATGDDSLRSAYADVQEAESAASVNLEETRGLIVETTKEEQALEAQTTAAGKAFESLSTDTDGSTESIEAQGAAAKETNKDLKDLGDTAGDTEKTVGDAADGVDEKQKALQEKAKTIEDLVSEIEAGTAAGVQAQKDMEEAKKSVSANAQTIIEDMEKLISALGVDVATMLSTMETLASDPDEKAAAAGKAFVENMAKGVKNNTKDNTLKEAKNAATGMITSAKTVINDPKTGATTVGKAFDEGVAKGVTDNVKLVTTAVGSMADDLIKKFKAVLGIASPSKAGAEDGGFFVAGVAKGILDSVSTAVSAVSTLGGSIRDAMGDLDLVPKGFSDQITNAFALASPTLPVPIMATGTIMTQGARMMQAASPAHAAATSGWLQDEDGLRDLIREEVGDLVRHTGVYFKGPGAKIARALSPELDRESRRLGKKLVEGDV